MIEIRFEAENCRSAAYDGEKLIGKCEFREENGIWTIFHTETDPAYKGQGIAGKLVEKIVLEARADHKKIKTECSFAAKAFERNSSWQDVQA